MNNTYKVTELNKLVKNHLESNLMFRNFFVEGEVSNLTYHSSGHLYFSLKDELACVKCIAFNYKSKGIENDIKNGEIVKILARVTLYEMMGQYQLLCESVNKKREDGKEYEKIRLLKEKLTLLGYFDQERKREIPLSFHIGVVTAESGAALKDIIVTAKKKFKNINISAFPARVQGENAEYAIVQGIEILNMIEDIDIIIIGRGGGSNEDLKAFNNEEVAKAIFNSRKPIISAVGHEINFVISDYVADKRASTPTQAADIVTPSKKNLKELLISKAEKLDKYLLNAYDNLNYQLEVRKNNYTLRTFNDNILKNKIYLCEVSELLNKILNENLFRSKEKFNNLSYLLKRIITDLIENERQNIQYRIKILKNLNPLNILLKGYSIIQKEKKIIHSVKEVKRDDIITIILGDGSIKSKVID